jgi:hypothetical protein
MYYFSHNFFEKIREERTARTKAIKISAQGKNIRIKILTKRNLVDSFYTKYTH